MGINNIGVVVKNDYQDILFYEDSFLIEIEVESKNTRDIIEAKLEEILKEKPFRIESVSKKIPKLSISKENDNEDMLMYLVEVYMYSDNSDFKKKEEILNILNDTYNKEYFLENIIRREKYQELVNSFTCYIIPMFYMWVIVSGITLPTLYDSFWLEMIVYVVIPMTIVYKIIMPTILNYLIKRDISKIVFKISKLISFGLWLLYFAFIVFAL